MYFPEQRLVIYLEYQYIILPNNIDIYLKNKNTYNMPRETRKYIIKKIRKIEKLIQNKSILNSLSFPLANNLLIAVLQTPRNNSMKY